MPDFKQFNLDRRAQSKSPFQEINGQFFLTNDILSKNFVNQKRGFKLNQDGSIFSNAGNVVLYDAVVDVNGNADYTGIQSAFDAGKRRLYVKAGTHIIDSTITVPDGASITGESRESVTLKSGDAGSITIFSIDGESSAKGNNSISNITFDGNDGSNNIGIDIFGEAEYVSIYHCSFDKFSSDSAIKSSGTASSNLSIYDNIFLNNANSINLQGSGESSTSNVDITKNSFITTTGTDAKSIILKGVDVNINGNYIFNSQGIAITLASTSNGINITNNSFILGFGGENAINCDTCTRININGNNIGNSKEDAIVLSASDRCVISANTMINNSGTNDTYSSILLKTTSTYNIINGNNLDESKVKYGIRENSTSDDFNIVTSNIVTGAVTTNISLQGTSSVNANNI